MAINPLGLAESLRPWRSAGIAFFLSEVLGEEEAQAILGESNDYGDAALQAPQTSSAIAPAVSLGAGEKSLGATSATFAGQTANSVRTHNPASPLGHPPTARQMEQSPADSPVRASHSPEKPNAHDSARTNHAGNERSAPQADRKSTGTFAPVPLAEWPKVWSDLFAKTKPALIVWTYPELGLDLSGQGDKLRSQCLRQLIGNLHLPKGSSAFWPIALPDDAADNSASAQIFMSGLLLLRPHVVVALGAESLHSFPDAVRVNTPFTQQVSQGILYVLLPHFQELLEKPVLAERSSIFLRSALSAFPGIFGHNQ